MSIILTFDTKRRQDISNRIKALEDALKGLLFKDDEQIDVLYVKRGQPADESSCVVMVRELTC